MQEEVASANIPTEYDTQTLYNLFKTLEKCLRDDTLTVSNENLEKLRKYHNFKADFEVAEKITQFFYCMTILQDDLCYYQSLVPKNIQKSTNKIIYQQKCNFCKPKSTFFRICAFRFAKITFLLIYNFICGFLNIFRN